MPSSQEHQENLLAYVPVIHRGYIEFFEAYPETDCYIWDQDLVAEFPHLRKDIRALHPEEAAHLVESLAIFRKVSLLGKSALKELVKVEHEFVLPRDDVSRELAGKYLINKAVEYYPVFLRWDRENSFVNVEVEPDRVITSIEAGEELIQLLYEEADKSSDWWRQVAAATVKDGKVLALARNRHLPTEYSNQIDSDPRNNAYRGVAIEASTVSHAEAALVARAAKQGESLAGAELFVTTFPCPACAKLVAESGIKACYFTEGYAMTDGYRALKDAGVEVIKVIADTPDRDGPEWVEYPEK